MADASGHRRRKAPATHKGSRPCDACRRRKTRCIVEADQPKCNVCLHRQNACTFNEAPPRRLAHPLSNTPIHDSAPPVPPSPHDILNLMRFSGQSGSPTGTKSTNVFQAELDNLSGPNGSIEDAHPWDRSLGLSTNAFAELYGLGSDMEPILMVR